MNKELIFNRNDLAAAVETAELRLVELFEDITIDSLAIVINCTPIKECLLSAPVNTIPECERAIKDLKTLKDRLCYFTLSSRDILELVRSSDRHKWVRDNIPECSEACLNMLPIYSSMQQVHDWYYKYSL